MRILILGGTGFTGPFQVKYALERGHKVTVFNRGKTHPGELPEGVEQLIGDRNGQLDALKDRKWDVVIDNPTSAPVWVRDAAQVLKGNVERLCFHFDDFRLRRESASLTTKRRRWRNTTDADAMKESRDTIIASKFKLYGPLKALSEAEAEKWFPEKDAGDSAGLDRGSGGSDGSVHLLAGADRSRRRGAGARALRAIRCSSSTRAIWRSGRSGWWRRARRESTMRPGRRSRCPWARCWIGIKDALKADAKFTWADADFLEAQKVSPWSDMPVWVPPSGEEGGIGTDEYREGVGGGD